MKTGLKIVLLMMVFCGSCQSEETAISTTSSNGNTKLSIDTKPADIASIMQKEADWQLAHPSQHGTSNWTHGALFTGLTAWAQMADDDTYYRALIEFGDKNDWKIHHNTYHADNQAVGQMYVDLYKMYKDPKMIQGLQECFDNILANPSSSSLNIRRKDNKKHRYWWCDALFMGPPTLAKLARVTGDQRYLDFMSSEWWLCTDYLYDTTEYLYYRDSRYFDKREANDKKVFWSRGNGWVFGGLVRVLEEMPEDYPDRPKFETLYRQMAAKIKAIQPHEGLWHSSLLDPVNFPSKEASGSGFYCYGLAWGINHGYLDAEEYLPAVRKAWIGLVDCVHPDGKLGYVQPIGADPRHVTSEQTEIYGVGSFLLAGSEVYKIALRNAGEVKKIIVTNPTLIFRNNETISIDWEKAKESVTGLTKDNVAVYEFKTNRLLVTQVLKDGEKTELLFQTNLSPGEKKYYWIMKHPAILDKPTSNITTFGRFVPERKDDFAWESDKIAFRMYGKALEDETISSGIDVWSKSVNYPVIDKWYKESNYHTDQGEGCDFYKVGLTLGCGGSAIFKDGKLSMSDKNFHQSKIIANGPIRTVFELSYKPWETAGIKLAETKRISIDLGSNLSRIESTYKTTADRIPVAAGIITRKNGGETIVRPEHGWICYWQPKDPGHGTTGCGIVFPGESHVEFAQTQDHLLLNRLHYTSQPLVYYAGACWDKNDEFKTFENWQHYLKNFKQRIDNPVGIQFAD